MERTADLEKYLKQFEAVDHCGQEFYKDQIDISDNNLYICPVCGEEIHGQTAGFIEWHEEP